MKNVWAFIGKKMVAGTVMFVVMFGIVLGMFFLYSALPRCDTTFSEHTTFDNGSFKEVIVKYCTPGNMSDVFEWAMPAIVLIGVIIAVVAYGIVLYDIFEWLR